MIQLALALAPFFLKFSLFLLDRFITNAAAKEAAKRRAIQAAHDYNANATESAGINMEYAAIVERYLAVLQELKAAEQAKVDEAKKAQDTKAEGNTTNTTKGV